MKRCWKCIAILIFVVAIPVGLVTAGCIVDGVGTTLKNVAISSAAGLIAAIIIGLA